MNDWYQRMVDTLQLNGKGERTQQAYTRSVRMLSQFYDKTPDLVSEQELQEYFLQRKNVNHWAPKTMRICYCGIRFFYVNVLERDPKHIGADLPGFFGVLHTWGRTLQYHPHIHYVVAGGALCSTDGSWHPSRIDFFLPVQALSQIFRAKFRDLMEQAKLFDQVPAEVWHIDWNVNCQAVSSSEASLKYLAPYVFKVAISNSRIVRVQDRTVLIRYRKPHSERSRILALDVMEFIRRFLQHVLPTGFMKIRYYGLMNPNCAVSRDRIRCLIELSYGFAVDLPIAEVEPRRPNTCKNCGGLLKLRALLLPAARVLRWSG